MPTGIRTAEELLRNPHIGRCELIRGELHMMSPSGAEHGLVAGNMFKAIAIHVDAHGLGKSFAAETGFQISRDPDTVRAPDVAFVRAGRPIPPRGFYVGAPDLAVEVLSPDDRPGYVREKVAEWLESGARAVWVVDPRDRTVTVHERRRESVTHGEADTLRGGSVLPGFELAVRAVFA
ncbi:MAG TPA: Uma2 family endonuclease [Planctomycetota bacterium]|nr:Uma2 family endonuclease [Planctomycetota bacterium]